MEQTFMEQTSPAGRTVADAMLRRPKLHGPHVTAGELQTLFLDDHVHAALLVGPGLRLLAVVERADLAEAKPSDPALPLGGLDGRTTRPAADLTGVWQRMIDQERRRLAVVDAAGLLVGLLALKRSRAGFCTDAGVQARRAERRA
ncbi:hypothetical protein GCM10027589_27670 [Actinocorallia lasiicapitis]